MTEKSNFSIYTLCTAGELPSYSSKGFQLH